MVLAAAIGFALQSLAGYPSATLIGAIAGVVIAPLVPAKGACGIRPSSRPETQ